LQGVFDFLVETKGSLRMKMVVAAQPVAVPSNLSEFWPQTKNL